MTVQLSPLPVLQFFDDNGIFLVGGKLFTYAGGTTTKLATYTDSTGTTPNKNPVILDARGDAIVWLPQGVAYKFVLAPATDTDPPTDAIWTVDNIMNPVVPDALVITGTTTNSMTIESGSVTFTTQSGLNLNAGQWVVIADQANVNNAMVGQITSYVGTSMTVDVTNTYGSGTFSAWNISLTGPPGPPSAASPRVPLLVTAYGAGTFTFTAPADTLTSDVFEFDVTGSGGGYITSAPVYGGGAGGTAIYFATGLTAGETVAVVVGAGVLSNSNGNNSTVTVGATTVTGHGGGQGDSSGRNGGQATNGTYNFQGGSGFGALSSFGSSTEVALGGASIYGSSGGGTSLVSAQTPAGAGASSGNTSGDGLVIVKQYRGSGAGSQLTTIQTIASATTTNLGSLSSNLVHITGTTTITSFGSSASTAAPIYFITFAGILQLTYNGTSLILPSAANITTAAGDFAIALYLGSGNWQVLAYYRASGQALVGGSGASGGAGGYVNKFRNATMDVCQRGNGSLTISNPGAYTLDGWFVTPTGATQAVTQTANTRTGALTQFGLKITGNTSVTGTTLKQRIEGAMSAPLNGQLVTVSGQIFNNTGGSLTPKLTVNYPDTTDTWSSSTVEANANGVSFQACGNGVWTQFAYTFQVSGTNPGPLFGMEVIIDFGGSLSSGTTTVILAELDVRATPGVSVGLNAGPPIPELRSIGTELALNQRYFATTYGNGVAPGSATRNGILGISLAGNNQGSSVAFPNQMRSAPTISYWDGAGNSSKYSYYDDSFSWHDNNSIGGSGTIPLTNGTTNFTIFPDVVADEMFSIHYTASAEL